MALNTDRRTVDLSAFPDLVVIYLGMRVNELRGLKTILRFGPKIAKSVAEQPDGLLSHENMLFSVVPPMAASASIGRTSSPWRGGRARCHTRSGGPSSCATRGVRGSGTNCTSCAAGWRQSTSI
jgi:hypothetical protein